MTAKRVKLQYRGSMFWLIFWLVIFYPIALVLLLTGGAFTLNNEIYSVQYDGSRNWLCFWTLAFFPVAIILGLVNGISVLIDESNPRLPVA